MGQFGKQHKRIQIPWACPVLPLTNFILGRVGENIENCSMKFLTPTLTPPYFKNNTVETI